MLFIQGTKHRKENQLYTLEHPYRFSVNIQIWYGSMVNFQSVFRKEIPWTETSEGIDSCENSIQ